MSHLNALPPELKHIIITYISISEHPIPTLASLSATSHLFYTLTTPYLYDLAAASTDVDSDGDPLLLWAAKEGHTRIITYLLDRGISVFSRSADSGYAWTKRAEGTALHRAAQHGHLDTIELLLKRCADIDEWDKFGESALHYAARFGQADAVKLLINRGAPRAQRNHERQTALHLAAYKGHADTVEVLLQAGVDVMAENKFEMTPLQATILVGEDDAANAVICKKLLKAGAHVELGKCLDPTTCWARQRLGLERERPRIEGLGLAVAEEEICGERSLLGIAVKGGQVRTLKVLLGWGFKTGEAALQDEYGLRELMEKAKAEEEMVVVLQHAIEKCREKRRQLEVGREMRREKRRQIYQRENRKRRKAEWVGEGEWVERDWVENQGPPG